MLMLIVVNVFYYRYSHGLLREEGIRANELQASRFALIMDTEITSSVDTLIQLESSQWFAFCLYDDSRDADMPRYSLEQLRQQLRLSGRYRAQDLLLYFKGHDLIVSSAHATANSRSYYTSYYGKNPAEYGAWKKALDQAGQASCFVVYDHGEPRLAVSRILPTRVSYNKAHVVGMIVLHPAVLSEYMSTGVTAQGAVAVYTREGDLIVSSDPDIAPAILPDTVEDDRYTEAQIRDERYYISVTNSRAADCRYVSIVAADLFAAKTRQLFDIQLVITAFVLVAGFIAAYIMTKRNMRPIEDTVRAISNKSQIGWQSESEDEFDYMKNAVDSAVNDKLHFQKVLDMRSQSMQPSFLNDALRGVFPVENADLRSAFSAVGLPFLTDLFAIIIVRTMPPADDELQRRIQAVAWKQTCICHAIYMAFNDLTLLINLPPNAEDDYAVTFAQAVAEALPMEYTLAVSTVMKGAEGIKSAFLEASMIMGYETVYGRNCVLTPDIRIDAPYHIDPHYIETADSVLYEAICRSNLTEEALEEIPNALKKSYSDLGVVTPDAARGFIYDTRHVMEEVLTNLLGSALAQQLWGRNREIWEATNLPDFCQRLIAGLAEARSSMDARTETDNELADRIDSYLDAHYTDANLNLSLLEPVFGMSGAYLSEKYKMARGLSIPDRLSQIRVDKICQLLVDTDASLEQIGIQVGLSNTTTLIRVFKKYKGMTPGMFRKRHSDK